MSNSTSELELPVGFAMPDWTLPPYPTHEPMYGRTCSLMPLMPELHAASLYESFAQDVDGRLWTYLPVGPFASQSAFDEWIGKVHAHKDPQYYAIIDAESQKAVGVASYLRITPQHGSIEVGHLAFSPLLQRTTAATEAMYLMMRRAFELGYRRYEWKCDSLNAPSRAAAERLRFTFEGIFRQAVVTKSRNRDTAWYSVIDKEWPDLKTMFERWLDPANFDRNGRQIATLGSLNPARHDGADDHQAGN